jgi:hypothetical protein
MGGRAAHYTPKISFFMPGTLEAEGEGFEPPVGFPTVVFKTTALDRSAIPPIVFHPQATEFYHSWQPGQSIFYPYLVITIPGNFLLCQVGLPPPAPIRAAVVLPARSLRAILGVFLFIWSNVFHLAR